MLIHNCPKPRLSHFARNDIAKQNQPLIVIARSHGDEAILSLKQMQIQ